MSSSLPDRPNEAGAAMVVEDVAAADRAQPHVSVVMPFYNKAALVRRCARALLEAVAHAERAGVAVETIFVDHSSTDGAADAVRDEIARSGLPARLLTHRGGTVSAVRNVGVRAATAPLIGFVDSDCLVPPTFLTEVVAFAAESDVEAFGCEYDPPTDGHWSERVWDDLHNPHTDGFRRRINGGDLFVRREALTRVGGWNENLEAGEDDELCLRLLEAGYRVFESRRLAVIHLGNPKSLREFYRKQQWHGAGTLDSATLRWRPMALMIYTFMASWPLALAALFALDAPLPVRLVVAVALVLAVPALAVAMRCVRMRRIVTLPGSLALYFVFFGGRGVAMLRALVRLRFGLRRPQAA